MEHVQGGAYNALLALWSKILEKVQKEIMDDDPNIAAIYLYLFHDHLWCLVIILYGAWCPKGEIVGIMILAWLYDTGVVLDGNSYRSLIRLSK